MQILERFHSKKSRKGHRLVAMAFMLMLTAVPHIAAGSDDVAEMSIDEAIDMAYDEYIRDVSPDAMRPYAAMSICGESEIDAAHMARFVLRHNPDFDPQIAREFIRAGSRYGIRGDIAFCQAIVETGWFKYTGGTAVTPDSHNYCGLGVTSKGRKGAKFATVADGVTAHIQHLYAYCTTDALPPGERKLDPRFDMVIRGCAKRWHELNGRWAMNSRYSTAILSVYASLNEFAGKSKCQK